MYDTGYHLKDLPRMMASRDRWQKSRESLHTMLFDDDDDDDDDDVT